MELTQLQGQQIGKKFTPVGGQINIGSASGNQIQNPGLPANAAQINIQNGQGEIKPMHPSSPVFVNGNQVKKTSPIKYGDTISVGHGNNVVLGAHPAGQKLGSGQIGKHLGSLNFSGEQIAELTNKIFNFSENQAIQKKIFILIGVLSVLLFGIIFSYTKLMGVSDDIQKEKNILNKKLVEINSQLEAASVILGKNLVSGDSGSECDPEEEDCDSIASNTSSKSLFDQISDLKSNIEKLKSEQKKAIAEMKKVAANPKNEISKEEKNKLEEEMKKQEENLKIIKENQKNINKLGEIFGNKVKNIESKIKNFLDFRDEIKSDVKDVKKFSSTFDSAMNIFKEENQIRDNKIKSLQSDVDNLSKKDDRIDVEIKKLQEEINSLEIKIKNLK